MVIKLLSIVYFLLLFNLSFGQNDPCITTDKKQKKSIEEAKMEPDFEKSSVLYTAILQKYPENAEAPYLYAKRCYTYAMRCFDKETTIGVGEQNLKKSFVLFQLALKKCPTIHADCPYYIGSILLSNGDKEKAAKSLQVFLDFPQDDFTRLPNDYETKKTQVIKFLKDYEEEKKLLDNPVPFSPSIVVNVSSALDEYFPMISPDNDLMFFTRKVDRTNLGDIATNVREEFTVATKNASNNQFSSGQPLPNPFNDGSFYNYGTASLSVDNKEMIICACKMEKVYNQNYLNCDLYTTTFKRSGKGGNDFKWAPLVNMGEGINTKDGWEAQPSLSADGKLLFYTTLRKGSRDNDIYFSERMPDGSWSVGKPFDIVNTAGKDKSPFFHQDGETLYFVSESNDIRKGVGGLDIFYIRKEKDTWTSPKNIGYPINSSEDELGLFVSTDGKSAYYSSMKEGDWNIYSFDLYKEARPQEVVIIKGELKDENNVVITDAEIEVTYEGSDEKTTFKVNGDDGKYAAVVKVDQADVLALTVKKEGFAFTAKLIETEVLKNPESKPTPTNFKLETISPEKAYNINDILFASDSYVLTSKAQLILSGFASYLKENESLNITIQGHTDDLGIDNENKILSQQRADAVRSLLISKGVSEERMKAVGYGESKPKYPNNSEENRTKNRRTEFMIQN